MPSNAAWLLSKMVKADDMDNTAVENLIDAKARCAYDAAERAREAEELAVEASRESKALADHARAVSERGHAHLVDVGRQAAQVIQERVGAAQKAAEEFVRRERNAAQSEAEQRRAQLKAEIESEIAEATSRAEAAQQRAEELVADAAEESIEAKRLADEAADAATWAAEEAQRRAQQPQSAAEQHAASTVKRVEAAKRLRERRARGGKQVREIVRDGNGFDTYRKTELVELAAGAGIARRSAMTKSELVSALTRAARQRAREATSS